MSGYHFTDSNGDTLNVKEAGDELMLKIIPHDDYNHERVMWVEFDQKTAQQVIDTMQMLLNQLKSYGKQAIPQYTHDCAEGCVFLGRFQSKHPPFHYDLYIHPRNDDREDDLLARYGNEGHEYASAVVSIIDRLSRPDLDWATECFNRAREKNLL